MITQETPLPASYLQLQQLLAELSGNELVDIHPKSLLEDDLGLELEIDLPRIVARINQIFIDEGLELDAHEVFEELDQSGGTVIELARIIDSERELG